MKYDDGVQKAIDYIEDHLTSKITLEDIAIVVGYSMYHFHRIFQSYVKAFVTEYIRYRRLTHTAIDILNINKKMIDIALNYRFETQNRLHERLKECLMRVWTKRWVPSYQFTMVLCMDTKRAFMTYAKVKGI